VVAHPLFMVLYGDKWAPAVLPFQLLCAGGMLKLLNAYASQANEAVGNVWPQARRQAIGAVLVVAGAWTGSRYGGVTGAALGVAVAMMILTASMQALVRRATGLSWRALLAPQVPAAVCSGLLAVLLLAVERGLYALTAEPAPLQLLILQTVAGALFYFGFVVFSPFPSVRDIVAETIEDTLPPRVVRLLGWRRGRGQQP
jgi:O-antigen/teichoic acid export membrane protein